LVLASTGFDWQERGMKILLALFAVSALRAVRMRQQNGAR